VSGKSNKTEQNSSLVNSNNDHIQKARGQNSFAVRFDEETLERARTQWQFGDWESLTILDTDELKEYPERARLALLCAAGYQQQGAISESRRLVRKALEWGADRRLVAGILIAGVHNTLGRAFALGGYENKSLDHFWKSINTGTPGAEARLLVAARIATQIRQTGLVGETEFVEIITDSRDRLLESSIKDKSTSTQTDLRKWGNEWVKQKSSHRPVSNLSFSIRLADMSMMRLDWFDAIRRWQDIISIAGVETPKYVYDRLNVAYELNHGFPVGTDEEETRRGEIDKYQLLLQIHEELSPDFYFEIGVQHGVSLSLVKCKSLGIDPMPQITKPLSTKAKVIQVTSDKFFEELADEYLSTPPDLVFIDGMHLFEYTLRDFVNVEKYSAPWTIIVIDDVFPCHPAQAERRRRTKTWTGDVWKLYKVLQEYRTDLSLLPINANPTGVLVVTGLDASNRILTESYEEVKNKYSIDMVPPNYILERTKCVVSGKSAIHTLIERLKKNED
jgi:hypothetical protein